MAFLDQYANLINQLSKALLVSFLTTLLAWFLALIGIINTNPSTVYAPGTGLPSQLPFQPWQYLTNIFLPIFIIALAFSFFGEYKMSNMPLEHFRDTLSGSFSLAFIDTLIIASGGILLFSSVVGFLSAFWLGVFALFLIYHLIGTRASGGAAVAGDAHV